MSYGGEENCRSGAIVKGGWNRWSSGMFVVEMKGLVEWVGIGGGEVKCLWCSNSGREVE